MNKRAWLIPVLIAGINGLVIALQWGSLPEHLPAHFDLQGNAGGTMPRDVLPLYPLAGVLLCVAAYLISMKAEKCRRGMVVLAAGVTLVLLLSTMVTLTSGKMPVFMLAEPVVLLASVLGFIISAVRPRKKR